VFVSLFFLSFHLNDEAGGLYLEKMFSKCWDLVQASDVEVHYGDMHDFVSIVHH
jgi:hypothetical protein